MRSHVIELCFLGKYIIYWNEESRNLIIEHCRHKIPSSHNSTRIINSSNLIADRVWNIWCAELDEGKNSILAVSNWPQSSHFTLEREKKSFSSQWELNCLSCFLWMCSIISAQMIVVQNKTSNGCMQLWKISNQPWWWQPSGFHNCCICLKSALWIYHSLW